MKHIIHKELQDISPYVRICVRTKTYPGWSILSRVIYDHELVLTSSGHGEMIIGGETYKASKGDLFLIKPGVVHSMIASAEDPYETLVVHFDFFYERDRNFWPHKKFYVGEEAEEIPDKHLLREVPVFEKTLVFPDYIRIQNYTALEVLMRKLIELYNSEEYAKELLLKAYLMEVLHLLLEEIHQEKFQSGQTLGFEKIKKAYTYIHENYREKIHVDTLASLCNLSTNYFATLFKQQTGYAPNEYMIRVRIEKAKFLLRESGYTVSEISEQVGFNDIHYFSYYFKKIEGLSPTHYRMTVKEEA